MVFTYSYKTSDGVRHTDTINADSSEDAFRKLRSVGIRPIKVEQGDVLGLEERRLAESAAHRVKLRLVLVLGVLGVVAMTLSVAVLWTRKGVGDPTSPVPTATTRVIPEPVESRVVALVQPALRHQIQGIEMSDALLEKVFPDPADRFLARYAQPGEKVEMIELTPILEKGLLDGMNSSFPLFGDEPRTWWELKNIVAGMKEEMVRFLKLGGTVKDFARMLVERQRTEFDFRERVRVEFLRKSKGISHEKCEMLRREMSEPLRVMGMRELESNAGKSISPLASSDGT